MEGAHEPVPDADVAAAYRDLDGTLLVELGRGAAEGRRRQEHAELPALQRVDGQPRPCQQAAEIVHAPELADGVESPVEDAVAGLKFGQETLKGLGRRLRLRGKVCGLGLVELLPHPAQARRVLPDEKLGREVQGVERPGEGPQLRLVDLKAHHLADAQLHPVQPHRTVLFEMREHEEEGQLGRELGRGWLHRASGRLLRRAGLLRRRPDGLPRWGLRSPLRDSFKQLLHFSKFLCSMELG